MCEVRTKVVDKRMASNFDGLFPGKDLLKPEPATVVSLVLQTQHAQTAMSDEMMTERTACYKTLVGRMKAFQEKVAEKGHWCDFIDPATGAPFNSDSATTLIECDERYRALGFEILELGCCRAVACEKFGQCCVMTSAFIQAPEDIVKEMVPTLEQDPPGEGAAPAA
eukprot:gnl/TRDRNA2_/TRDRNA2_190520_c0_seq1.p1 gnl/TRDRNA2_/TRDRNA2_190520_c0~~gnl/TRDRNA2_/TRDRNA2_190520_c0_seq1.p1  ORF type:complete len:167 (-),score=41.73 gnl/TRDRNA2_/TRDRNA2_190520_c0_seq1:199-699(-)